MAGGSIKAETVRNDRQPWDSLPALMMADGKERGIKMTKKDLRKNLTNYRKKRNAESKVFTGIAIKAASKMLLTA